MEHLKLTKDDLENLIMEELDSVDEGVWSTLKGYASGVGSALTSPLGKVGQGYKRGKAASALKSTASRLENIRKEFIEDIEDLFMPIGSSTIQMPPELVDVQEAWNKALDDVETATETFERLSVAVTRDRRQPRWGSTSSPAPAEE